MEGLYKQAGAQKRTAMNAANAHFDFRKALGKHMEEELAKLPLESDREAMYQLLMDPPA